MRRDVAFVMAEYGLSQRQACKLLEVDRSSVRYEARPDRNGELRKRLVVLAQKKPRYGYRRLWVLLRREGRGVNLKRVYRLYREARLGMRLAVRKRLKRPAPAGLPLRAANEEWALDFLSDAVAPRRADPDSDGAGRVHAAVSGDRSRSQYRQPESDAGAGADDRQVGSAEAATVRQRAGVHEPAFSGLVRETRHRGRPHSAGAADAERFSGELQRPAEGRVPECELVREPGRGEGEDRGVEKGVQHREAARAAWDTARRRSLRDSAQSPPSGWQDR